MTPRMMFVSVTAVSLAALMVVGVWYRRWSTQPVVPPPTAFAQEVDLAALNEIAVYEQGRIKSFASFASSMLDHVSGPNKIHGNPPGFSYMDLMLRPEDYRDDVIYVKNKPMRGEIVAALRRSLDAALQQTAVEASRHGEIRDVSQAGREGHAGRQESIR